MRTDLIGSQSLARGSGLECGAEDVATLAEMPDFDAMEPLDALRSIRGRLSQLEALEVDAMWRARLDGLSWRTIAAATGINASTIRRWAAREPSEFTRRRR